MGVRVTVAGQEVYPEDYRISESSMPIIGGDTSGSIGTIDMRLSRLPSTPAATNLGDAITLLDTNRGSTSGVIRQITPDSSSSTVIYDVTADNKLGLLNIETQAAPYSGTIDGALKYYLSLAGIHDSTISGASASAAIPGWRGNLWVHLKEFCSAKGLDLCLINNVVTIRPIRSLEAIRDREIEASSSADGRDLALKQEVVWYKNTSIASGLIYPPDGWNSEVRVLSVNAGETIETTLETNSSIFSLDQPVADDFVSKTYVASSVYTVSGDDGIVIQPAQWQNYGGSLSVRVAPDTLSIIVTVTGATGLVQANGTPMKTFRIGLSSGTSTSDTYSTLRIVGKHIKIEKNSVIVSTGVDPSLTGQEFAPTIDNVFLNNINDAYSAATRGARRYAGRTLSYSASISELTRHGETGSISHATYAQMDAVISAFYTTYGDFGTTYSTHTYGMIKEELALAAVLGSFDNQIFGNAPGARIWDKESGRWYRIRNTTVEWGSISVDADDDMTNGDMKDFFSGQTYGQAKLHYSAANYYKSNLRGAA